MCNLIFLITVNIYLSLNSKKRKVGVRMRKNILRMWTAMEMEVVEREMGARIEKSARMEMEMQRRRKRRMKRRVLLHNLCSGTYDHFMKNFI
jgi:hypothetical protein